jgi:putative membrane protein
MRRLTAIEREQIGEAIAKLRNESGIDLHVAVMPMSDRYALYPLIAAGLGALIAAAIAALVRPVFDGRTIIFIQLTALIVLTVIFDWKPLRIALAPRRIKQAHARQLAHRAFAAHLESDDGHPHKILLFTSIAEHYAEILADHATHARVDGATWDRIVEQLTAAANSGRVAEGILSAITACGAALGRPQDSAISSTNPP